MDIWNECNAKKNIKSINETAWRLAESLEKISTRKLVDSIEEQDTLDELIAEAESRSLPENIQTGFHPLLYKPFKFPPLKHGSRFGTKTEPSLWYGSLNIETAMAEKAFYKLAFINASAGNFGLVITPVTAFSVNLNIVSGLALDKIPFIQYKDYISSPTSYEATQILGQRMRENNLDGFTYISARDKKLGINVGLFKKNSFESKNPNEKFSWLCTAKKISVEFTPAINIDDRMHIFPIEDFQVDGSLPAPAI